jgi:hypothetical protein
LEGQKLIGVKSSMRTAVRFGGNLIAGGWVCPEKMGARQAAVWTSSDFETWVRRPIPYQNESLQFRGGVPEAQINDIVVFKDRLYAVGTMKAQPLLGRPVNWDAAVWTSTDGATWQQVKGDLAGSGAGDQYMTGVTTWAGSLVAVGGSGYGLNTSAAVWISRDGANWSRATGVEQLAIPGQSQSMNAVTTVDKVIVAVGYKEILRQKWARIWTSMDGENWTLGETVSRLGEALSIERRPSGVVVVGWQRPDPSAGASGWTESRTFAMK